MELLIAFDYNEEGLMCGPEKSSVVHSSTLHSQTSRLWLKVLCVDLRPDRVGSEVKIVTVDGYLSFEDLRKVYLEEITGNIGKGRREGLADGPWDLGEALGHCLWG